MNKDDPNNLTDHFPALAGLQSPGGARRIPYIQQLAATDCGAACLAMVLAFFGKKVPLDQVREVIGTSRSGADALSILEAARWYGLRGRGIRLETDDIGYLDPGAILHWEFNHFVVFERQCSGGVDIVDPGFGRRHISIQQFHRSFTGVALTLEPSENFQPTRGESRKTWRYLGRLLEHRQLLSRILMVSVLIQVFALAVPVLTGVLVDRVVPRADYHLLTVLSIGLLSIVVFRFLSSVLRAHLLLSLQTHLDTQMTLDFIDHLVDLPFAYFQQRSAGDLMMRLNSNTTVREILTSSALSGLLDGALVSLYVLLLFAASPTMGLLALSLGVLRVLIFLMTRRKYRELVAAGLQAQAHEQNYEVEMLAGIETLKASGVEHRAVEHWTNLFVDVMNLSLARGRLSALVDSLMDVLDLASPLLILTYGGYLVLEEQITLGTMLAVSALAVGFLGPLATLVSTALQLQLLGSYLERINEVFDTAPEQDKSKVTRAGKLRGQVALQEVSFRYSPLAPLVVREVSAEIKPNQQVAIVGRSGSGKSTLAKLLLGLYRPTSGRILYDGVDLTRMESRSLRRQLGIVPQNPYLFGSTIRANIAAAEPALSLEQVMQAARLAHIHEDIMAMPMEYDTIAGDAGSLLSAGQRQRVALARALVHQPAILLLDEATSALDAITEAEVQRSLASLPCTKIVIAHRLSTVVNADLILVMENGSVAERGSHEQLMALNGKYVDLVAAQLRS